MTDSRWVTNKNLSHRRFRKLYAVGSRDGWHCAYCGCPVQKVYRMMTGRQNHEKALYRLSGRYLVPEPSLDHVVPRSAGGGGTLDNLVLSCHPCNVRKGAMGADEFAEIERQAAGA